MAAERWCWDLSRRLWGRRREIGGVGEGKRLKQKSVGGQHNRNKRFIHELRHANVGLSSPPYAETEKWKPPRQSHRRDGGWQWEDDKNLEMGPSLTRHSAEPI